MDYVNVIRYYDEPYCFIFETQNYNEISNLSRFYRRLKIYVYQDISSVLKFHELYIKF